MDKPFHDDGQVRAWREDERGTSATPSSIEPIDLDPIATLHDFPCGCQEGKRRSGIVHREPCAEHALMQAADGLRRAAEAMLARRMA
jgi:hypothetical protein